MIPSPMLSLLVDNFLISSHRTCKRRSRTRTMPGSGICLQTKEQQQLHGIPGCRRDNNQVATRSVVEDLIMKSPTLAVAMKMNSRWPSSRKRAVTARRWTRAPRFAMPLLSSKGQSTIPRTFSGRMSCPKTLTA